MHPQRVIKFSMPQQALLAYGSTHHLKHIINLSLSFLNSSMLDLTGYSDSAWTSCPGNRYFNNAYCTFLGMNLISWNSQKQKIVSRSFIESEYRALSSTTSELSWLKSLLFDLSISLPFALIIFCDNFKAEALTHNPIFMHILSILKQAIISFVIKFFKAI